MGTSFLVTGGSGFLGSALVRRLVQEGHAVRVLDDHSRGAGRRLRDVARDVEMIDGDVRDPVAVGRAVAGVHAVCHLAFVNGTEFFYTRPDLVLDVGVKGIVNVLDACLEHGVEEFVLASSSEVYQMPPVIPADESVPLSIPDPLNPRYSYAGGKIISELMALHYAGSRMGRVVVFRPHNVYGPDMGWEHVIPEFALRMRDLRDHRETPVPFPIQGSGDDTRAFVFVDDFIDGLMLVIEKGEHRTIYNIGTQEEVTIADLARAVGRCFGREVRIVPGRAPEGRPVRRCPDIARLAALGYRPRVLLAAGLPPVTRWYDENAHLRPERKG